jgi:hypothetical protein
MTTRSKVTSRPWCAPTPKTLTRRFVPRSSGQSILAGCGSATTARKEESRPVESGFKASPTMERRSSSSIACLPYSSRNAPFHQPLGNRSEIVDRGADIEAFEHEIIFRLPPLRKFDVGRNLLLG